MKKIVLLSLPWLILLSGLILFIVKGLPEYGAYQMAIKRFDAAMNDLTKIRNNAPNVNTRKIVTALEKDYEKLGEEYTKVQEYLEGKYTFQWADQYAHISSLDFKNLLMEKRKTLNRSQIGFEEFDNSIPDQKDVPDLLRRMEISETLILLLESYPVENLNNISISKASLTSNQLTNEPVYEEYITSFEVEGSFKTIIELLYAIEHHHLFFVVNRCQITSLDEDKIRAELTLRAIRFLFA